ncbi:ABC transporter permease [Lacrimispora brassicae]
MGFRLQLETLDLPVLQGRFLEPVDTNLIVLNHAYLDNEPDFRIGDTVTIKTNGKNIDWVIKGIVKEVGASAKAYVNAGLDVMISSSFSDTRDVFLNHLALIAGFLIAASVLVIMVGVMGLVSTTTMNVMERIREIGIMRSYGAVSKDILHIVIFDGIFIGAISWIISLILSVPLSCAVGDLFGRIFLQTPLDNVLNLPGYGLWFLIIVVTTVLVGFGVTLKVLEMPVNEVLSYE